MSLEDLAYYSTMSDKEKIEYLEEEVAGLNRAIALQNKEKLEKMKSEGPVFINEKKVEIFANGLKYVKCVISKEDESEFIDISFLPIEGKVLQLSMTEKAFKNFIDIINRI